MSDSQIVTVSDVDLNYSSKTPYIRNTPCVLTVMGGNTSKADYTTISTFLLMMEPLEDETYWEKLFAITLPQDVMEKYLHINIIRNARLLRNPNLKTFFNKVIQTLEQVIALGLRGDLTPAGCEVATNCVTLLGRIIPVFLEVPLPHELKFMDSSGITNVEIAESEFVYSMFWTTEKKPMDAIRKKASQGNVEENGKTINVLQPSEPDTNNLIDEYSQDVPLAIKILVTLHHLLFLKNFTIALPGIVFSEDYVPPRQKIHSHLLWKGGIGGCKDTTPSRSDGVMYTNRQVVLRCLVTCLSSQVYRTSKNLSKLPPCLWLWSCTRGSLPYTANLYCSIMSIIYSKKPSSFLGLNLMATSYSMNFEELRSIAAKVMCILLCFDPTPILPSQSHASVNRHVDNNDHANQSNAHAFDRHSRMSTTLSADPLKVDNIYRVMFSSMKDPEEMGRIFEQTCSFLRESCGTLKFAFGFKRDLYVEEHLLLLWNALTLNSEFLKFVLESDESNNLVAVITCLIVEASSILRESNTSSADSEALALRNGLLHLCSLILFVLSSGRHVATQLNESYNERLPIHFPAFHGCYADFVILSLNRVLLDQMTSYTNESLIDIFLTTLCNISPYIKSLCVESCVGLVSLFKLISRPSWLMEQPYRYRNVFILLESFDNLIQYQYEGNIQLVYSILRQNNVFVKFENLTYTASAVCGTPHAIPPLRPPANEGIQQPVDQHSSTTPVQEINCIDSSPNDLGIVISYPEPHTLGDQSTKMLCDNSPAARCDQPPQSLTHELPLASPDVNPPLSPDNEIVPSDKPNQEMFQQEPETSSEDVLVESTEQRVDTSSERLKEHFAEQPLWYATEEWFNDWKEKAPTQTIMCVINALLPTITKTFAEDMPEQEDILQVLRKTTLVGILPVPPPILIRNYVPHPTTNLWFTSFTWRVIVHKLRHSFLEDNLLFFSDAQS